jgi:hypothetical protein
MSKDVRVIGYFLKGEGFVKKKSLWETVVLKADVSLDGQHGKER